MTASERVAELRARAEVVGADVGELAFNAGSALIAIDAETRGFDDQQSQQVRDNCGATELFELLLAMQTALQRATGSVAPA